MFGYEDDKGNKIDTGISCVIIRSGSIPRYNSQLVNVLQSLKIDEIVNFIETENNNDRKVLMFTTMASHTLKYSDIIEKLKEKEIKIGIEIVDEYHNVISTSSVREKQEQIAKYLENNTLRCNGTIFYSASNKDGQILSSFNEEQFGPLLCKVNRNDLRVRGIVAPKLLFKVIRVNEKSNSVELKRDATRINLDIDKAQVEAVGIIKAQKDIQKYYVEPNLITFGSHVAGCHFIKESEEMLSKYLPGVKNYVMSAITKNSERDLIIDKVKDSGNNILHQHSVAKEGINIPNLHGGVIGRGMSITTTQQAIGRSDRALNEDTIKFEKGELSLDNPTGWKKYYNIIYLIVDSSSEMLIDRFKEIVKYLTKSC
jgi:superfamily II DNA or RNA helicase